MAIPWLHCASTSILQLGVRRRHFLGVDRFDVVIPVRREDD
jgi:hypothetical protein